MNDPIVAAGVEPASSPSFAVTAKPSWAARALREPLLLFLIAGALLFAGYRLLNPPEAPRIGGVSAATGGDDRIVITKDDLLQMSTAWLAQGRPPPTTEQWQSLIESKVHEEIMFREALRLGLDKDDAIIKRRLMQKMEFLAEDSAQARLPSTPELKAWYNRNKAQFVLPGRVSFSHLYFSPDKRHARARPDAGAATAKVKTLGENDPRATALGDPFMFQDRYAERSPDQIAKEFGPDFARELFNAPAGKWSGPIQSGYGWHVIFVESFTAPEYPPYESVADDVRNQWLAEAAAKAKTDSFASLRARYTVELPPKLAEAELAAGRATVPASAAASITAQ